ncbi:MAG: DegV family protein [Oscillospiraceae bacterium]|nr:DegV family protein [Oscillospiraceae bacterium]
MEQKIIITADSTCDLSPELIDKYGIKIVPLYVTTDDGNSYKDGIDINPSFIFDYVAKTGKLTKTAAVTVADYETIFKQYTDEGYSVIHINISSEFSACYQNANIAKTDLENVYVVDSRNLSTGSGLIVLAAAEMVKEGKSAPDIAKALNELTSKVEASFVVDKLTYLKMGGRCSSVAALGANLLNLKPCIEVRDGKMGVGKKYRGNLSKSIVDYVNDRLKGRNDINTKRIFITHTPYDDEIIEKVKSSIKENCKFDEVIETVAGCTISTHCGPGTLGILFLRK